MEPDYFVRPRLRAPSYFCDNETEGGLHLHYRSKRRGFVHYTMGQLRAVAEAFYKIKLQIEVIDQEIKFDTIHVEFRVISIVIQSFFYLITSMDNRIRLLWFMKYFLLRVVSLTLLESFMVELSQITLSIIGFQYVHLLQSMTWIKKKNLKGTYFLYADLFHGLEIKYCSGILT